MAAIVAGGVTNPIRDLAAGGKAFFCPGCDTVHCVNDASGPQWSYNGDPVRPTFAPSILVTMPMSGRREICHSYVTNGRIRFLPDSTHALAGKTVDLPPWPYAPGTYGGVIEP